MTWTRQQIEGLPWQTVQSSQIRRVAWIPADDVMVEQMELTPFPHLFVEFGPHSVYRYLNVPREIYDQLTDAASAGRYLNAAVKGSYPYEKLEIREGNEHDGDQFFAS